MRSKLLKFTMIAAALGLVVAGTGAATVQMRYDRTFDVADVATIAVTDSAVIARGAYLAYGPAHCAYCHTKQDQWARLDAGEQVPMSGGNVFEIGIASIPTANITPDKETGIGDVSDAKLARMLRHNVRRDGRAAVPFMEYQNMSDEDIVALISYIRSQDAVRNEVPAREFTLMGKAIMSFLIKPSNPTAPPPATAPPEAATVERGEYLVASVANCAGCHTKRSQVDGSYQAPRLSGGTPMEGEDGKSYTPPNLTPAPNTGHIYKWTEDQFVSRFRAGPLNGASHMPWRAFARMSDQDIRAIFRYLKTVPPTENAPGPLVAEASE
ncbi:MAG TPA: c-type cytochrome [Longimicrobiales bacterium]|nr:c-type cytochrome [Longimicrobiales bacterium]